jgi:FkbM family methyltransferase
MKSLIVFMADKFLTVTGLQYWPVRVRQGVAKGARWTLYPWSAYWRGSQEPEMHEILKTFGSIEGWSCWDLGAHFGIYAIGLARRVGPTGQVAAFEPNPQSHARLERHRKMNALPWLQTFPCAVSDRAGVTPFYTYGNLKSTTTHLPYVGETADSSTRPINVTTVQLDDLVAEGKLRLPNFIKCDVEGHAHRAFAGARRSLAASRPILIVAIHSEEEIRGILEIVEPLDYNWRLIATSSGSADELIGHDVLFTPRPR